MKLKTTQSELEHQPLIVRGFTGCVSLEPIDFNISDASRWQFSKLIQPKISIIIKFILKLIGGINEPSVSELCKHLRITLNLGIE